VDDLARRVARRFLAEKAEEVEEAASFAKDFFKRHPRLKRYAPSKIVDKTSGGGGGHPEARQSGQEIQLYPKFWKLDDQTRDFVFAHEIGHWQLSEYGLTKLISDLNELGVDPWDSSNLPFGQGNMDEAFADCFATFFLDPAELKRRYPAWETVVEKVT
jgi:hypothetical protein